MIDHEITVRVIVDSRSVLQAIERKSAIVLVRAGTYTSKAIRGNVVRRKSASRPGQLPSHRNGPTLGLKATAFAVNRGDKSVVAGSIKFPRSPGPFRPVQKTVPQHVNKGGSAVHIATGRVVYYSPRPYVDRAVGPSVRFFKRLLASVPLA